MLDIDFKGCEIKKGTIVILEANENRFYIHPQDIPNYKLDFPIYGYDLFLEHLLPYSERFLTFTSGQPYDTRIFDE